MDRCSILGRARFFLGAITTILVWSCWSPIERLPGGGKGKAHQIWWVLGK